MNGNQLKKKNNELNTRFNMKCIQLDMDGIRYFVTVKTITGHSQNMPIATWPKLRITLYVNSLGTTPIFTEEINGTPRYFTKKDAKKFVLRALSVKNK